MRTAFRWCNRLGHKHPELPSFAATDPSFLAQLSGGRRTPLALVTSKRAIRRWHNSPDREDSGLTSAQLRRWRGLWLAIDDRSPRNCDDFPATFAGSITCVNPYRSAIVVSAHLLMVSSLFLDNLAFGKDLVGEDTTNGIFGLHRPRSGFRVGAGLSVNSRSSQETASQRKDRHDRDQYPHECSRRARIRHL